VVAVQVVLPFQSSAELSVAEPSLPPATTTVPLVTMLVDSRVAVWPWRAVVIVPALIATASKPGLPNGGPRLLYKSRWSARAF